MHLLVATTGTPPSLPTPKQREAVSKGALLTMALLLAVIAGVVVWSVLRSMRKRVERLERVTSHRSAPPTPDPWTESAKRLATPAADDLEDTRTGAALRDDASDQDGQPQTRQDQTQRTAAQRTAASRDQAAPSQAPAFPSTTRQGDAPIVLITGASKRLGRAIALHFAQRGCDLILTYNTSREHAETLAREISSMGRLVTLYQLALDDLHAVRALGMRLGSTLPRLDVLVHNASTYEPTPFAIEHDGIATPIHHDQAERQMRVNALAPLVLTLALAPALDRSVLKAKAGVVALGDIHAMGHPRKGHSAYAMSKAALHEMVRSLARDLAPRVRVNALALGVALWPDEGPEAVPSEQAKYLRRVPMGREATPEEVAACVSHLAMDASYITGQIVPMDGGRGLT
jgi:pteridine reductase